MTEDEHRERHVKLHAALDELAADFLSQNRGALPSTTSLLALMAWSHEQTLRPTAPPGARKDAADAGNADTRRPSE